MRQALALGSLLALSLTTVACGDDGGGGTTDAPGGGTIDGGGGTDATPPVDAIPFPDAPPGAFTCLGAALPTTAPDPITVSGDTSTIGFSGTSAIGGIQVQAFANGNPTPLATATSAQVTGAYTMTAASGGVPINGYLVGEGGNMYLDNYLYPATPLYSNITNGAVLMVEPSIYNAIHLLVQANNDKAKGFVGLIVLDCLGNPVPGATVTVTGAEAIHYSGANGLPSAAATATAADGQAYAFGVTPGTAVMVDATVGGMSLREHAITVRTNAVTTTIIVP